MAINLPGVPQKEGVSKEELDQREIYTPTHKMYSTLLIGEPLNEMAKEHEQILMESEK